ncbi:sortase [Candidatus Woesebacteria bacterium]|nr:sortase [Candidatus Woesebacteria bacterium]
MALVLRTQPAFLRQHFYGIRCQLVGQTATALTSELFVSATMTKAKSRRKSWTTGLGRRIIQTVLSGILLISIVFIGSFVLPEAYTKLVSDSVPIQSSHPVIQSTPVPEVPIKKAYAPAFDATLPQGTWLKIPSIGVDSPAQPTATSEEALSTGVWLVPDFGRPGDTTQPMIMAAHRFGWKSWWKSDYWKKNSFYLLATTKPGDRIEVVYEQRKWVYEIYAGEEGEQISDYDADLILYTCKFLNSPIRYFRYARLIEV